MSLLAARIADGSVMTLELIEINTANDIGLSG
jgi:hypothetical protein